MTTRPKFIAQGGRGKRKEVKARWRRPKGLQSKLRLAKKGHPKKVMTGYRTAVAERDQTKGMLTTTVQTVAELASVPEKHGVIISGRVGMKKRTEIISAAQEKKLTIINIKDPEAYKKKVADTLATRKKKVEKRVAKKKAAEAKAKKDEKEEAKEEKADVADDVKKEAEKKELDKVLTQK